MYLNQPVLIPKIRGITTRKKDQGVYVQYETDRIYNPNRKHNSATRVEIGIQIPGKPELMLPNENYFTYIPKGEPKMENHDEKTRIENYETERERMFMLRDFFEQLFFEFQIMSRKRGNSIVNANKVKRMNKVLGPLMEMMSGEAYAGFLELIPEPEVRTKEDGSTELTGMSYSDVALLMSQFKGAVNRFFMKKI